MDLAYEPRAERQRPELCQAPVQRRHVVEHLFDVGIRLLADRVDFEHLGHRRARALDPRRGQRLAQQIRPDQKLRVRHDLADSGEPSERCLRVSELPDG